MAKKTFVTIAAIAAAVAFLAGCSNKQVHIEQAGATRVQGTDDLYRFCDGTTLIYFTDSFGDKDEYEFVIYDGCSLDPAADPRVAGE